MILTRVKMFCSFIKTFWKRGTVSMDNNPIVAFLFLIFSLIGILHVLEGIYTFLKKLRTRTTSAVPSASIGVKLTSESDILLWGEAKFNQFTAEYPGGSIQVSMDLRAHNQELGMEHASGLWSNVMLIRITSEQLKRLDDTHRKAIREQSSLLSQSSQTNEERTLEYLRRKQMSTKSSSTSDPVNVHRHFK